MRTTRSLISLAVLVSMIVSSAPAAARTYSSSRYRDNPIDYVQNQGYMTGYDNGSFGAGNTLNRAEFAKVVTLVDNGSSLRYSGHWEFWDADQNAWYAPYVRYVNDRGYMTGYNSRSFGPDRDVTFEEAAKALSLVFDLDARSTVNRRWSDSYVRALADRNAIPRSIEDADDPLTRGELADIVYRLDTNDRSRPSRSYRDVTDANNDHCYYDLRGAYYCDDYDEYNYDTYYQDNDCYIDGRGRSICDDDNDCYYDRNGRYRCNNDDNDDCSYDRYGRYRCHNDSNDCYYDQNGRYRCDDDDDGDCVYDSDGRRVCGTANNSSGCYYDSNNRYRCSGDDHYQDSNCYYDNYGRYRCDDDYYNDYNCYYDSNNRYRCDGNDNDDCYYDANNRYVCY